MPETPEQRGRQQIDAQLGACGWVVQDYKQFNPAAGRGIALREVPLTTGPCDYLPVLDRKALGVIEAKKEGTTLSMVADQSARYASSLPDFLAAGATGPLPFLYESTGIETYFRDSRDPAPRSRRVFSFHRPETLAEWAAEPDTLRYRLAQLPVAHPLATNGMRDCQVEAITGLERSFAENRPRALIAHFRFSRAVPWAIESGPFGAKQQEEMTVLTKPQTLAWLNLIRDLIATSPESAYACPEGAQLDSPGHRPGNGRVLLAPVTAAQCGARRGGTLAPFCFIYRQRALTSARAAVAGGLSRAA